MPLISHKLRALSLTRAVASVPEARVGRQLGFQHPIAAARLPHGGQQPLAHGLGRELCVEDALGCGRQLLDQIGLGPLPEGWTLPTASVDQHALETKPRAAQERRRVGGREASEGRSRGASTRGESA